MPSQLTRLPETERWAQALVRYDINDRFTVPPGPTGAGVFRVKRNAT